MFLFHNNPRGRLDNLIQKRLVDLQEWLDPNVAKAKKYLDETHPTLLDRDSIQANRLGIYPFHYIGCSRHDEYTRYYFCQGSDKRIIYVWLSNEERKKIIQLFTQKMKEKFKNYKDEFKYNDSLSLKGRFVGRNIMHRFYSNQHRTIVFMSDNGDISSVPMVDDADDDE